MILPFEITAINQVVTTAEQDPIVFRVKRSGVVIHHRRVPNNAVVGIEVDHRSLGERAFVEEQAIHGHIRSADLERRSAAKNHATRTLGPDLHRLPERPTLPDDELRIRPVAILQHENVPGRCGVQRSKFGRPPDDDGAGHEISAAEADKNRHGPDAKTHIFSHGVIDEAIKSKGRAISQSEACRPA